MSLLEGSGDELVLVAILRVLEKVKMLLGEVSLGGM